MPQPAGILPLLRALAAGEPASDIFLSIAEFAKLESGFERSAIHLLNEERGTLEGVAPAGVPEFSALSDDCQIAIRDRFNRIRAVLSLSGCGGVRDVHVDLTVEIARLLLRREERSSREEALLQIGTALDNVASEADLIQRVTRVAEGVLRFQACSIFLLDERSGVYTLRGTTGIFRDQVGKIGYAKGEGFTGWVCSEGKPILLNDPQTDVRWRGKFVEIPSSEIASFLAVPIVGRSENLGAIRVLRRKTGNLYLDNSFTEEDLRLLKAIADQIAAAVDSLRNLDRVARDERMIAWGELSAKSSHMIGNRVFALQGDVNELGHLLAEGDPARQALDNVHAGLVRNVGRIQEILREFRDFVTATNVKTAPVDLNRLVRETAEELVPPRGSISLDLASSELPLIEADESKLRRAIGELIDNSLSFMTQGCLRVATSEVLEGQIRFARVDVADSGPGVSPELRETIFQPFFTTRSRGMGLGLSIVQGIVEAHGGRVFEAGGAEGAHFAVLLPIPAVNDQASD